MFPSFFERERQHSVIFFISIKLEIIQSELAKAPHFVRERNEDSEGSVYALSGQENNEARN